MLPHGMFKNLKDVSLKYIVPSYISILPFWSAGNAFFFCVFAGAGVGVGGEGNTFAQKFFILSLKDVFTVSKILGWQLLSFSFLST